MLRKFDILNRSVSHVSFAVIFTASLFVVCNALIIDRFARWFRVGEAIDYAGLLTFLFFGFCAFLAVFILFTHRWTTKPLAIILVVLSAAATYFISKYDIAVDRSMVLNTVHTDPVEVRSLLSVHMLPYVFFLIVLPVAWIVKVRITFRRGVRYLPASLVLFGAAILAGIGSIYLDYNAVHRAMNISNKQIAHQLVPVNVIRSIGSLVQRSLAPERKARPRDLDFDATVAVAGDLVVVLAIGETSRQKSFSLYGYDRKDTNPKLSQLEGLHLLNGIARVGTTLYALPEILARNDVALPAVTSKAGIETSCFVNYTLYENCLTPGEVEVDDCGHGGKCYDEDVLPLLDRSLKEYESGYRFIVLHFGGGSHGPSFNNRHPPEWQHFNPQCFEADVVNHCSVEELYNSYDNTILYVDHVVSEAIQRLDASGVPYVFIYVSDHGESLLEDGRIFHGMPPGIPLPPEQAQVPLIVKSSVPIDIDARAEYPQQAVYDSVLALFSVETDLLNREGAFISRAGISMADNPAQSQGAGAATGSP